MPLKVIVGSTTKDAARASVYPSTTAKRATRIEAWNGSAWKLVQSFAPPMTLAITPNGVEGITSFPFPVVVVSDSATATPTGGVGPYTYVWTISAPISPDTPNAASTTFSAPVSPGSPESGTATCTATDSLGTTTSATVVVTLRNISEA